jgi:Protein tyrosine and serine/threonine kinase/Leucine rich repeat N-terminal domain
MAATIVLLFFFLSFIPLAFSNSDPHGATMSDAVALLHLKESFANTSTLSTWSEATNPCDQTSTWHGVVCDAGNLIGLRLSGLGLGGQIDVDALLQFNGLRSISFENNLFTGPLPAFERLTALKSIYLSDNQFSGTLPENFFIHLVHLKKLWLDGNLITGSIPPSLGNATNLIELHIERNKFEGTLPSIIPPPSLSSFNVSYNDLEGTIPDGFKKFDLSSFKENPYLCSTQTANQPCEKPQITPTSSKNIISICIIAMVAMALLVATLQSFQKNCSRPSVTLGVERDLECDKVHITKKAQSNSRRNSFSLTLWSRRSSSVHSVSKEVDGTAGLATGDLIIVNQNKGVFGMLDLMKAAAEVLGSGGIGSVYKAVLANGVVVAVKRVKDMNRVAKEVFDMEMRRLGGLRHPNVLSPLAYNFRKDEKLLISEFIPKGSLLYVLHGEKLRIVHKK